MPPRRRAPISAANLRSAQPSEASLIVLRIVLARRIVMLTAFDNLGRSICEDRSRGFFFDTETPISDYAALQTRTAAPATKCGGTAARTDRGAFAFSLPPPRSIRCASTALLLQQIPHRSDQYCERQMEPPAGVPQGQRIGETAHRLLQLPRRSPVKEDR